MKRIKATLNEDNVKFFCNKITGVVVCEIESFIYYPSPQMEYKRKRVKCVGKAVCGKDDKYDEVLGKRIAESRAKVALYGMIKGTIKELKRQFLKDLEYQKGRYEKLILKEQLHIEELTL